MLGNMLNSLISHKKRRRLEQSVHVICVPVQETPTERMRVLGLGILLNAALPGPDSTVVGALGTQSLQCYLLIKLNIFLLEMHL